MKTIDTNSSHPNFSARIIFITGWMTIMLFVKTGQAQSLSQENNLPTNVGKYFGYELSVGTRSMKLHSDIKQLNLLPLTQLVTTAGIVYVTPIGKLKANAGLGYSGGRTPYTINALEASATANVYLLKLLGLKHHSLEPYAVTSIGFQSAKFFGTYLSKDVVQNYSICDEPSIGQVSWLNASAGLGVDYKIAHDDQHFIHLFAEALAGGNFLRKASNSELQNTRTSQPMRATIGISFGLSR